MLINSQQHLYNNLISKYSTDMIRNRSAVRKHTILVTILDYDVVHIYIALLLSNYHTLWQLARRMPELHSPALKEEEVTDTHNYTFLV